MSTLAKRTPISVRPFHLRKLKAWEKKVMLQQLGIPASRLPKSVGDMNNLLESFLEERSQDVNNWYNVIIMNILPDDVDGVALPKDISKQVEKAKQELWTVVKDLAIDETSEKVAKQLDEEVKKSQKEIVRFAKAEIIKAASHYRPIEIKTGKKIRKVKGVFPEEFPKMLQLASQRVPMLLVGPAGCGKTFICGKIAESLGLEAYDQSCSEGISESTFTGWLLPTGAAGRFEYIASPFITCYENGGVFLFDEMDSADANLLTFLNKAIANDYFYLPQRFKNPKVVKHPDFVAIGAANTFGAGADEMYVGRNALDAATLDRFKAGTIALDYSAQVEEALVDAEVLEWGRDIRKKIRIHKLFRVMSTRVMLDMTKMKQQCEWTREDWDESYFTGWSSDERRMVA